MADDTAGKPQGRAVIDWEEAFAFYASLQAVERSYAAVARQFAVSRRTVEKHGRTEQWKSRLRSIKEEARSRTAEALTEARVEEIDKLRRLIDASHVVYAEALRNGMRMSPADLERLNRLSVALLEEATAPRTASANDDTEPLKPTPEHARAVLDALADAGALEALGLTRISPDTDRNLEQEEGDDDNR